MPIMTDQQDFFKHRIQFIMTAESTVSVRIFGAGFFFFLFFVFFFQMSDVKLRLPLLLIH